MLAASKSKEDVAKPEHQERLPTELSAVPRGVRTGSNSVNPCPGSNPRNPASFNVIGAIVGL